MQVCIEKILRRGKKNTRVLLSTGEEKVFDSSIQVEIGQLLDYESQEYGQELRPLQNTDPFPSLLVLE